MPKPKNGTLGRKVKMSQPVAIPWDLAIDLVAAKVVKPPTVPKMEPMEKWIVAGGRSFDVSHDDGLTVVIITAPGIEGRTVFRGEGETLPLATARAIQELWQATPQPDPNGADLPLFRGNGGVASVAEMRLEVDGALTDMDTARSDATTAASEDDDPDARESLIASGAMELPPVREWTWLNIINPGDAKRWKQEAPSFEGSPVLEFEAGDDSNERGWYLDPDFFYDREMGIISQRNPVPGQLATVWSRDVADKPGAVEATTVNLVTASAD